MATTQLHSFVTKFVSLWADGQDVSLNFNSKNGKAHVTMQVELGDFKIANDVKLNDKVLHSPCSSRQRRRIKRSSFRDDTVTEKAESKVGVEAGNDFVLTHDDKNINSLGSKRIDDFSHSDTEEVKLESDVGISKHLKEDVSNSHVDTETAEKVEEIELVVEAGPTEADFTEDINQGKSNTEENVKSEVDDGRIPQDVSMVHHVDTDKCQGLTVTALVTVYANANLSQCSRVTLSDKDFRCLEGIYHKQDHLKRNLRNVEFGKCNTYRSNCGNGQLFDHIVDVKFEVDPSRLWENARSYTWKHLGQYEWKLADGTLVTFNRIHVK